MRRYGRNEEGRASPVGAKDTTRPGRGSLAIREPAAEEGGKASRGRVALLAVLVAVVGAACFGGAPSGASPRDAEPATESASEPAESPLPTRETWMARLEAAGLGDLLALVPAEDWVPPVDVPGQPRASVWDFPVLLDIPREFPSTLPFVDDFGVPEVFVLAVTEPWTRSAALYLPDGLDGELRYVLERDGEPWPEPLASSIEESAASDDYGLRRGTLHTVRLVFAPRQDGSMPTIRFLLPDGTELEVELPAEESNWFSRAGASTLRMPAPVRPPARYDLVPNVSSIEGSPRWLVLYGHAEDAGAWIPVAAWYFVASGDAPLAVVAASAPSAAGFGGFRFEVFGDFVDEAIAVRRSWKAADFVVEAD